jgi:hypothetical protein
MSGLGVTSCRECVAASRWSARVDARKQEGGTEEGDCFRGFIDCGHGHWWLRCSCKL